MFSVHTQTLSMIFQYSQVQLATDKFESEGGQIGMVGYVIESCPDGKYEIEFSNEEGVTIAQFVATEDDLTLLPNRL